MNKKAILIIIGLMSVALIGIILLQINLIRSAAELKEEQFDQNVFDALNDVAKLLEQNEDLEYEMIQNGFYQKKIKERSIAASLPELPGTTPTLSLLEGYEWELERIRRTRSKPLNKRIQLNLLKKYIKTSFANHNIRTKYHYGVFSNEKGKDCFIIEDGYYVVEENQPQNFMPGQKNLYTSDYWVHLFSTGLAASRNISEELNSPGKLYVFFPNKKDFVWSQLWVNIISSVLFTLVIMFCFGYTIDVIFKQKKLSSMKTDFINNMTHEFKTPIATISLAADSITSPMIVGKSDKVKRFANIIRQENKRMNAQVEKVLQMALLDKKEFELKLTQVNLHDIIGQAIENINLQVEKREGNAYADLNAKQFMVEGDLTHLSNIINNLLDNANKYSPEKPEISVHTRNVPNGVEVIVKDRGVGMSKEARKHIFDKFYRVHTGDLHDVKGFGLGLSYVKAMMTAHKGTIDVKSELGKGSSFILFFPFRVSN